MDDEDKERVFLIQIKKVQNRDTKDCFYSKMKMNASTVKTNLKCRYSMNKEDISKNKNSVRLIVKKRKKISTCHLYMRVRLCVRACVRLCVSVYVHPCVRACVHTCVRACMHTCV